MAGEYYHNNTKPTIEKELSEQHALTINTIASAFSGNSDLFNEYLERWANTVAQSRVEHNIPIHEVLEALSKTRETVWGFIEKFILENKETVTTGIIAKWSAIYHAAFDQLNYKFSKKYYHFTHGRLTDQQSLINELGSPVIPILKETAVLPLIGDIDTKRARFILETTPQKCTENKISQLFIDVSGVPIIDTLVANELFNLTKILGLLGIKTVISGIPPEVAQASIQLGLDFSGISTFGSLRQALSMSGVETHLNNVKGDFFAN
ncbi:STAS domain-containing protein [Peribacillus cavernae]|uniref:STAS domain-containing protein n=2 Tax=Peribacillus cavernae TaxID=1674310 RepID=A0A433HI57_9BACI|nr:STAS domain-containing protein [Peribacillus cavernae]